MGGFRSDFLSGSMPVTASFIFGSNFQMIGGFRSEFLFGLPDVVGTRRPEEFKMTACPGFCGLRKRFPFVFNV